MTPSTGLPDNSPRGFRDKYGRRHAREALRLTGGRGGSGLSIWPADTTGPGPIVAGLVVASHSRQVGVRCHDRSAPVRVRGQSLGRINPYRGCRAEVDTSGISIPRRHCCCHVDRLPGAARKPGLNRLLTTKPECGACHSECLYRSRERLCKPRPRKWTLAGPVWCALGSAEA